MRRTWITLLAVSAATSSLANSGPVPKESLMTPPEDATRYVIVSDTNTHGDEWRWETEEGAVAFRKSQSLRGWITETDALVVLGYDGKPMKIQIRGVTPQGDAAEEMVSDENGIRWDSGADSGTAPLDGGVYLPRGGPNAMFGLFVEYLLDKGETQLLPSGQARLRDGGTLSIEDEDGDIDVSIEPITSRPLGSIVSGSITVRSSSAA